jgi:hypothetical protein
LVAALRSILGVCSIARHDKKVVGVFGAFSCAA